MSAAAEVVPLVCAGRIVDARLEPTGEPCGKTFKARGWDPTSVVQLAQARAAGWSVGGPPMCPSCRRPDPAIARGLVQGALLNSSP